MAITITVDGTALPMDWQAQQTSNPADLVDRIVLAEDLTTGQPESTVGSGGGGGTDTVTLRSTTTKGKK